MTNRARARARLAVLAAASLVAAAPASAYDLTIGLRYELVFTPDVVIDFDDLAPGHVLLPGDPVAPGVVFGGPGAPAEQRAVVVDHGGGRALAQVDLGSEGASEQSDLVFTFTEDVRSVGARIEALGNATNFFPDTRIHDAGDALLSFASVPASVQSFLGWEGQDVSTPIRAVTYQYLADSPADPMTLDDFAILYVPEPPGGCAAGAIALAGLALARSGRRRARRRRGGARCGRASAELPAPRAGRSRSQERGPGPLAAAPHGEARGRTPEVRQRGR
jgi:hypothetical protein